jgi:hypothetical protein
MLNEIADKLEDLPILEDNKHAYQFHYQSIDEFFSQCDSISTMPILDEIIAGTTDWKKHEYQQPVIWYTTTEGLICRMATIINQIKFCIHMTIDDDSQWYLPYIVSYLKQFKLIRSSLTSLIEMNCRYIDYIYSHYSTFSDVSKGRFKNNYCQSIITRLTMDLNSFESSYRNEYSFEIQDEYTVDVKLYYWCGIKYVNYKFDLNDKYRNVSWNSAFETLQIKTSKFKIINIQLSESQSTLEITFINNEYSKDVIRKLILSIIKNVYFVSFDENKIIEYGNYS